MWARVENGNVTEIIVSPKPIVAGDVQYPESVFRLWKQGELAAIGIFPLAIDPPAPAHAHEVTGETLAFDAANSRAVAARTYRALPEPVPERVTKLQLVRALREDKRLAGFKSAMAQAGADTREDWENASLINASDPLIAQIAAVLGLTPDQRDALLRRAAQL